jgi:hypothetical protein
VADHRPMRILVVVKTYPTPSQRYGETVCCAGVDLESGNWVRMYPITFRRLASRFRKFEIIDCRAAYPRDDQRPESRRIDQDSIATSTFIGTGRAWQKRLELLPPLAKSMEELVEANREGNISIGAFRPQLVSRLVIEAAEPWSEKQLNALRQQRMKLGEDDSKELRELEQLPVEFSYRFRCEDVRCRGHKMRILDWEIGEAYRKWSHAYPEDWERRIREKFEHELPGKDLILVVGTMAAHPNTFVVIGLIYPPRPKVDGFAVQQTLDLVGKKRPMTRRRLLLEAEEADSLGGDERQETLDLFSSEPKVPAVAGDEGLPVPRQRPQSPGGTERGKG